MTATAIIGCVLIVFGVLVILLRNRVHRFLHSGMKKFYGEGVADMSSNPKTMPRYAIFVGVFSICLGVFNMVEPLLAG